MEKLRIRITQNQFFELVNLFHVALKFPTDSSFGNVVLKNSTYQRMRKRCERFIPLNGLVTYSFTFYVYEWEICLLTIAKMNSKTDAYNGITINEIVEKLHLHKQKFSSYFA